MSRYRVTIAPRFQHEGGEGHDFVIDTRWQEERERYGETAREIAMSVAADFCDSGNVRVVNTSDPADRATIARR